MKARYYEYDEDGNFIKVQEVDADICQGQNPPVLNIELGSRYYKKIIFGAVEIELKTLLHEYIKEFNRMAKKQRT